MYQENFMYGQVLGAGLLADIACPDGDGPFPVILSVHGGRWIAGDRRDTSAIDVRQWAGFGYFALSIDYRYLTCTQAPDVTRICCARSAGCTPIPRNTSWT